MHVKNRVSPERPWHTLHETEPDNQGNLRRVNTIFLTNSECPFNCIMCDLWKNTLDTPVPPGAIPSQIEWALNKLPDADVIKLYNSGNFFDKRAIPPSDYQAIANLLKGFDRIVVENHPSLCSTPVLEFSEMVSGNLEVALGLETVHPVALPALDKQMTLEQYSQAAGFLTDNGIAVRSFILLNPPFITDPEENIEWSLRSVQFAFDQGVECCSVIPVRAHTEAMQDLLRSGDYVSPTIAALEKVMEKALHISASQMNSRRVFADLWDLEKFSSCDTCFGKRKERLNRMNLTQTILPAIECACNET